MSQFYRSNISDLSKLPLAAAITSALLAPAIAGAQEQRYDVMLEEVIVIGQRREQDQMVVPISMGTFDSDDLINSGAVSLMDMNHYIPGVSIAMGQVTQSSVEIRGVAGSTISVGGSPSVATFYDGSYLPPAATTVTFTDLERVEVLKGPQGTLFGRNAAGGVVNMIPNRPGPDTEGFISAKLGNMGLQRYEAMGNIALSDTVFIRANFIDNSTDGFANNTGSSGNPNAQDNQAARLALLWEMSSVTDLQLSYDWDKVDQAAPQGIGVGPYAYSTNPYASHVNNDQVDGGESRDMDFYSAKLSHEFGSGLSMKYLISYRDFETANRTDNDGTNDITRYVDSDNIEDSDITYSELNFNYSFDRVELVFGGSYSQEDVTQDIPVHLTPDSLERFVTNGLNQSLGTDLDHVWNADEFAGVLNAFLGTDLSEDDILESGDFWYDEVSNLLNEPLLFGPSYAYANTGELYDEITYVEGDFENWGIYGDATISLTPKLDLALGLRYSEDEKSFSWYTPLGSFVTNNPELGITSTQLLEFQPEVLKASDSWSKTTGRAVLSYFLGDGTLLFASYSTGYKAGGYDAFSVGTAEIPLEPEIVTNYEIGMKGDFFGDRLRVELGIYQVEVDDQQRNVFAKDDPSDPSPVYRAVSGDTSNSGVELTVDWLVLENLKLRLATGYADQESEYDSYINASDEVVDGHTRNKIKPQDAYTLSMDWTPVIPWGNLIVHADYITTAHPEKLSGEYLQEFAHVNGYGDDREFLNSRIGWISDDYHYEVAIWGQNLLDTEFTGNIGGLGIDIFDAPVASQVASPLAYGVDLRYNF